MLGKKRKQFILFELCLFFSCILFAVIMTNVTTDIYQKHVYEREGTLLKKVIEEHPENEEEMIQLYEKTDFRKVDTSVLEKYGYLTSDDLKYFQDLKQAHYNLLVSQIIFVTLLFIVLNIAYIWYQWNQDRKLKELDRYLLTVLAGNYNLDIRDYEDGILSSLKNDVYKMSVLLKEDKERALEQQKYLESVLSDISHQLRTPLTSMYVMNDLLSDGKVRGKQKKEILNKNRAQLERIEWLITTLLKMSRIDAGTVTFKEEKVVTKELIKKALEPINIPIELKKQTVLIVGDKKSTVILDQKWTVEAFVNLLKNAHEHTPVGGMIIIKITDNPLFTEFLIQDNGTGIAKEDLPHIFERFYKGKNSSSESIGIGLNMSKTIIQKENGTIMVDSTEGKGTTFTIRFYKADV
jgi:signal transduction histidine kinase